MRYPLLIALAALAVVIATLLFVRPIADEEMPIDLSGVSATSEHQPDAPRLRNKLGQALPFREAKFDKRVADLLRRSGPGQVVGLDFFPDARFTVRLTSRQDDELGTRLGGKIQGQPDKDKFFMTWYEGGSRALLQLPSRNLAYEALLQPDGTYLAREWLYTDIVCATPAPGGRSAGTGLPRPDRERMPRAYSASVAAAQIPALQSRPGVTRVVYLDFDGEIVNDPAWSSSTINAAPARLNESQITETWRRVVADFEPFSVNITTLRSDFDGAPSTSRTHVIITRTDTAAPGAGGVAYLNSFAGTSSRYCWAFIDDDAKASAEVISHEVGHTLNLNHDGRTNPAEEYYEGHGSSNTGWAPIMGVGYYRSLVQWSKGDYPNANRTTENDLQIIAGKLPYLPDDHGNATANAAQVAGTSITGRIEQTNDIDVFRLELDATAYTINVQPAPHSNLDVLLEILDAGGNVIASANPTNEIFASAIFTLTMPQVAYVRVRGTGKAASGSDFGYPAYSSLGSYTLSGFGNQQQPPSAPGSVSLRAISGSTLEVTWQTVPGAANYEIYRNGTLLLATSDTVFLDRGLTPGVSYTYQLKAANAFGISDLSTSASITTPAADAFVMDGNADFSGYLVSNPGMVIHAAVRGNRLYVSTWSPGDNGTGFGSDHHILISDVLLGSAATPNPWSKAGLMAIPGNKPFLAGESTGNYAGWFNASGTTTLFKGPNNSLQLEGSIDMVANFGSVPRTIYLAAVAFGTDNTNGINAQAPAGNGNNNLEPGEFLAIPVAAIRDSALDGTFDTLDAARAFFASVSGLDEQRRPVLRWPSIPGRAYQVQGRDSLVDGSWQNLLPVPRAAGPAEWEMQHTDTNAPAAARFYRVTQP
jgi:hypothetical protein